MLYLIATPIGNLGDISLRALEILRGADCVAAEDTRHSGHLLTHHGIRVPLVSYHQHNEARRTAELSEQLKAGKNIALITDAGMPSISDPGHRLLRACIEEQIPYSVIPGPSAVLTALVGSGFDSRCFFFGGFLPVKSGQRENTLIQTAARECTTVFFESPHRLLKTLEAASRILPRRRLCVARELTKKFEEYRTGAAADLLAHYSKHPPKGEIALVIEEEESKEKKRLQRGILPPETDKNGSGAPQQKMPSPPRIPTEAELRGALKRLADWSMEGGRLERWFECACFPDAVAWVNLLGGLAEAMGHHPDVDIRYRRVRVALLTHDCGAHVTDWDLEMASRIDRLWLLQKSTDGSK